MYADYQFLGLFLQSSALDLFHDIRVEKGGDIAEIFSIPGRDLSQDSTHDLSGSGLGQTAYELDFVQFRNSPHGGGDQIIDLFAQLIVRLAGFVIFGYKSVQSVSFDVVREPDHSAFNDLLVLVDRIFDRCRSQVVTGHDNHVIDPTRDAVIA